MDPTQEQNARIGVLNDSLLSLSGEVVSLRNAIIEVNAQRPQIVRIDHGRYQSGDMVVSMNNQQRLALQRRIDHDMADDNHGKLLDGWLARALVIIVILGTVVSACTGVYALLHQSARP